MKGIRTKEQVDELIASSANDTVIVFGPPDNKSTTDIRSTLVSLNPDGDKFNDIYINTRTSHVIAMKFSIMSTPTVHYYAKDGSHAGIIEFEKLTEVLSR